MTATDPWLDRALAPADGRRCCSTTRGRGLTLPDGRQRCAWHAEAADVDLVELLDDRGRTLGLPRKPGPPAWGQRVVWPYGPNVDIGSRLALVAWAELLGLRAANLRSGGCPHWPSTHRRCSTWSRGAGNHQTSCTHGTWRDHTSLWSQDGRPALYLAQPYHVAETDMTELQALDLDPRLSVTVRGIAPWYGYSALSVEVWRADAWQGECP